ncbi:hypothetical protein KIH31_05260 [Paenarthrobacter sp. DKR-5]|uniref:hypothetical protein n=1 Tax=Paenarthrobacter sp. DKR-5 TaxID=2835535 RepID=UPI001BDC1A13|nr:hypothetical protein [Paenarthrobacter sp. DKR-5]MBT1002007.1 hypothetical protein [Paenarthrobacter sp. DKR-5]
MIRQHWDQLGPGTRRWLLGHPGIMILPRRITTAVAAATGVAGQVDPHGEIQLDEDDIRFILNQAHSASAAAGGQHFFDAVRPGQADRATDDTRHRPRAHPGHEKP